MALVHNEAMTKEGIAGRIRARRLELGLTQAQVAKRGGFISSQIVAQYEQSVRIPGSYESITGLAKALECSSDYLLGIMPQDGGKPLP